MKKLYVIFLILILIISCQKRQKSILPAKYNDFVKVTCELDILRSYIDIDSVYVDSARIVLSRYGYDQESFQEIMNTLEAHPQMWHGLLTAVEKYKKTMQKENTSE